MTEKTIENVSKVLGEPIAIDFTEYVRKIRTNLLITSTIGICVVLGGIEINPQSQFFGVQFKGLTNELMMKGLIAINIYMLAHFLWCSFDSLLEWIVRITGTRVAFVTTGMLASSEGDYPSDPRQSTLYNWWKNEARQIGSIRSFIDTTTVRLSEWEGKVRTALEGKDPNVMLAINSINQVTQEVGKIHSAISSAERTILSQRIPTSLSRFDSFFELLLRSQNLRWLVLELALPILIGLYSLLLLFSNVR